MPTERLSLPSGAYVDIEKHVSPEGLGGVVAHWGERLTRDDVNQALALQGVEITGDLSKTLNDTGFNSIYHQRKGIKRDPAIEDELAVGEMVARLTLELNGVDPANVDELRVGSGVPITDYTKEKIDNYAGALAKRLNMREDVIYHSTYAACTSTLHEWANALTNLQDRKVLLIGIDNPSALTPDLDINYADPFSISVFSTGAVGLLIEPGKNMIPHNVKHKKFKDTKGFLKAYMTYERLLDPENPEIWQEQEDEKQGLHMIRYPKPEGDRLIDLNKRTAAFFTFNLVPFVEDLYREYHSQHPGEPIDYTVVHPASKVIFDGMIGDLARKGANNLNIEWNMDDGNPSAPATPISYIRRLSEAKAGSRVMLVSYGAGGSGDGIILEHR